MSEELRSGISLLAGAIVLVVCYIKLFLKGKPIKQKFVNEAEAKGNYTTATLVKHKRVLGNDESESNYYRYDKMKCVYEYKVNNVTYKKKLTFQSGGMVSIDFPYTVTIYYNPEKPSKGVCKEEISVGSQRSWGCFGSIVFACLTFIVIYNLIKLI